MNFYRIMYLDDVRKKRRLIIETTSESKAILIALLHLSEKCAIISWSKLKPYEIKRLKILEEKAALECKTIVKIKKYSKYPNYIFNKERLL